MFNEEPLDSYTYRLKQLFAPADVPAVPAAMALVTVLAWVALRSGWLPMPSPPAGLGPMTVPGVPEAVGTTNGLGGVVAYLGMCGVMMVGMMYPAMTPFVTRYADAVDGSTAAKATAVAGFLAAYSTAWAFTGVAPLALDAVVDVYDAVGSHGSILLGASLLLAGGYQFTAYKQGMLGRCCGVVDVGAEGLGEAARRGVGHAVKCISCTWAMMATMVVAGTMNAFWMLVVTFAIAIERHAGTDYANAIGVVSLLGGVVVIAFGISPV